MSAHDPPELTPEGQTLTLRWVLALAHEDRDAAKLVLDEMGHLQVHPADTILDLGLMTVAFAGALGALGFVDAFHNDPGFRERSRDHDGAAEVIELWMQAILDERDRPTDGPAAESS